MIRLFPTSLSLSESDIQFHLHQVDIYHGLRRQGFKQHEITRHLADYRLSIVPGAANFPDGYPTKIPSTVELALRQADQSCAREPLPEQEPDITIGCTSHIQCPWLTESCVGADISRSPFIAHEIEDTEEWVQGDGAAEPTSPIALPQQLRKTSHAPRKSSLLRFSKAAASDSPPPPDTQDLISPASASCLPSMRYTRRSHASPSQSALNSLDEDGISATLSRIAISDFTTHSSSRVSPLQDSELSLPQVSTPRQDCHPDGTMESFWPSSSSDLTDSSSQNSDLRHSLAALDDIPSSPPLGSSSPESYPAASSSGVTRNIPPRTPILSQTHLVDNRTEPRRYRHRFLDGNAFSVYNDSLPANDQPQTPADLSRRPVLTEYEASYTAPPGMIRNVSTSARALGPAIELGQGDVSPLARTINLTYRRTQEMRRSVRSNLDRIRRESELVQRIREIGLDQPDEPVTWMDEFELDRLGEENFESELDLNLRTIRVVSGNAHWDSLTDVER